MENDEFKVIREVSGPRTIREYEIEEKGRRYIVQIAEPNGDEVGRRRVMGDKKGPGGRPPGSNIVEFYKVYRPNWAQVVRDDFPEKRIDFHSIGVFFALTAFLEWERGCLYHPEHHRPASVTELADLMKFSRSGLFRYLKELEGLGLVAVRRSDNNGVANVVYLNPDVVYFGKYADKEMMPSFKGTFKPSIKVKRIKKVAKEG